MIGSGTASGCCYFWGETELCSFDDPETFARLFVDYLLAGIDAASFVYWAVAAGNFLFYGRETSAAAASFLVAAALACLAFAGLAVAALFVLAVEAGYFFYFARVIFSKLLKWKNFLIKCKNN